MVPLPVYGPKTLLPYEYDEVYVVFVQENCLRGNSGVIWGIPGQIWEVVEIYGIDFDRFYNLAICESGLNQEAIGPYGEIGIYQFKKTTFEGYAERYKKVDFSIENIHNQIELAAQMISNGLEKHWVCPY